MIRTCLLLPTRRIGAVWPLLIVFAVFIWLTATLAAHADRVGDNKAPVYTYYKQVKFYEAAMCYHRALRGLREMIMIGESLVVPPGQSVEISVSFIENTPHDSIELIGNPNGQVQVVAKVRGSNLAHSAGRTTWMAEVSMGSDPFYLRARGSACISQPYPVRAWFYTNPLWLNLEGIGKEER